MAVMYKGNKIEALAYKGNKINSLWYKGKQIYSSKIAPGTVMWEGPKAFMKATTGINSWDDPDTSILLINQTIELSQPISKLKNGITVNMDPQLLQITLNYNKGYLEKVPVSKVPTGSISSSANLSIATLTAKTPVKVASSNDYLDYVVALDDTHIQCYSDFSLGDSTQYNSTLFAYVGVNAATSYDYMAIVDSIVAY